MDSKPADQPSERAREAIWTAFSHWSIARNSDELERAIQAVATALDRFAAEAVREEREAMRGPHYKVHDLNLQWGPHVRDGQGHVEWYAPCDCAYHPDPYPHVHPCGPEHDRTRGGGEEKRDGT